MGTKHGTIIPQHNVNSNQLRIMIQADLTYIYK